MDAENKESFIKISYCGLCRSIYVECPHCGNNCCNGAYGKAKPDGWPAMGDDEACPICPKAYELQKRLDESGIDKLIEEIITNKIVEKLDDFITEKEKD